MPASRFFWYELMTTDVQAAAAFYKTVIGWNSENWGDPQKPYVIMKVGETGVAAGGKIYREPSDIPEIGRFSVVADPQGATFMLMTPQGPDQEPLAASVPGNVGWRELYTTDWKAALDFYTSQFGWTADQAMDMGEMGTYQLFAIEGQQAGGMMNKPANIPVPLWQFYFTVDGLDGAVERVRANGGSVMVEPMQVPGGSWIAMCADPQGAAFALTAMAR